MPQDDLLVQIQEKLDAATEGRLFYAVSYFKETDIITVIDVRTGVQKEYRLKSFIANIRRGQAKNPKKDLTSVYQKQLKDLTGDRLQLQHVHGRGSDLRITIFDTVHETTFSHSPKYIFSQLRRNSDRVFGSKDRSSALRKQTNLDRYGVESPAQNPDILNKIKSTLMDRHGVTNASQLPDHQDKVRQTSLEKYGVEHFMLSEEGRQHSIISSKEKYGGVHHTQHPEVKAKTRSTNMDRFGAESPFSSSYVREKIKQSWVSSLGVENPQKASQVRQKTKETRIEKGLTRVLGSGLTMKETAEQIGSAYSFVQRMFLRYGEDVAMQAINAYKPGGNTLTQLVVDIFEEHKPITNRKLQGSRFRPDLRFEDRKVIVEVDGLYWHSDASKNDTWNPDQNYHRNKLLEYERLGYRALFFRSHEIHSKIDVVKGIISNALGVNETKIQARKCRLVEISPEFFAENHLMGKGSGRCYGLEYEDRVVAGMQVRFSRKSTSLLDISRFCTLSGVTVVGGWSRLIAEATRVENPRKIQTFVDRRYGKGSYLARLGWTLESEYPSFQWTDGVTTYHRMRFKSNTGYDHGLSRIWDCGQAKWTLECSTSS